MAQDLTVEKYSTFGGNVLVVDQIYGNDTLAAQDPFNRPFLTLQGALNKVASGQSIYMMPGAYEGPITIPANVCIVGNCLQNCSINALNVSSNTTLVTMGSNTRLEFVTLNLTSSSNVNLTGVDFPTGTSITAKLRTSVTNVRSSGTGSNTIIGVLSAGTSPTTYNSSDAIRASTVSVDASSSGPVRGLLVSGSNWFSIRTTNIDAKGTGSNIVGVETTNAGAYASLKHSTIRGGDGSVPTNYDINRTAGEILVGFSDLHTNSANGNSFSTVAETAHMTFGSTGNFPSSTTFFMLPGVVKQGDLPLSAFTLPVIQNMILISGTIRVDPAVPAGGSLTLSVYKNGSASIFTIVVPEGETTATNTDMSVEFTPADTFDIRVTTGGQNMNNYSFVSTLGFY